jgi:two-component system response regulator ChvI
VNGLRAKALLHFLTCLLHGHMAHSRRRVIRNSGPLLALLRQQGSRIQMSETWQASKSRVLLVDDDALYLETMTSELEERGFAMRGFLDGASLLAALDLATEAEALLLDWTLPSLSGIDVLSRVRKRGIDLPVVFLTGRALVDYEHLAFDRGAIDFIDKTRGVDIIAQRLIRIVEARRPPARERDEPATCGPLTLRHRNRCVEWRGRNPDMTLTEYKIVSLLVSNAGRPMTYRAIYDTMHYAGFMAGFGADGFLVNVRSAMKRVRKKFLANDPAFAEIENHVGVGYSWRLPRGD